MASALTPTPTIPTTPVMAPDGADARTASSVRAPLTGILNGVVWLYNVLTGVTAQAIHLLSTLLVDGDINGSGNMTVLGVGQFTGGLRYALRASPGSPATGLHIYAPSNAPYVYNGLLSNVVSGCIWQISNYTPIPGEFARYVNLNGANAITIQDPTGSTMASLINTAGNTYAVTVCYIGGAWTVVDLDWH